MEINRKPIVSRLTAEQMAEIGARVERQRAQEAQDEADRAQEAQDRERARREAEEARAAAVAVRATASAALLYADTPEKESPQRIEAGEVVEVQDYNERYGWTVNRDGFKRIVPVDKAVPAERTTPKQAQKPAESPRTFDIQAPAPKAKPAQDAPHRAAQVAAEPQNETRAEWYRRKRSKVIQAAIAAGLSAKQMGVLVTLTDPSTPEQWPIAWMPREEIAELAGISPRSVKAAVDSMCAHGLIERADGGKGRTVQRYRINIEL